MYKDQNFIILFNIVNDEFQSENYNNFQNCRKDQVNQFDYRNMLMLWVC